MVIFQQGQGDLRLVRRVFMSLYKEEVSIRNSWFELEFKNLCKETKEIFVRHLQTRFMESMEGVKNNSEYSSTQII